MTKKFSDKQKIEIVEGIELEKKLRKDAEEIRAVLRSSLPAVTYEYLRKLVKDESYY